MKFYKVRVTQNAGSVASAFNESFKPEIIPDSADPYKIDWITEADEEVLVGEKVWYPLPFPPFHSVCSDSILTFRLIPPFTGTATG